MKKIALIILYFGQLPNYTKLFFHSLKYNSSIDLLLFTDQKIDIQLDNLIVYNTTFDNIKDKIQSKFDFSIVLDRPYKLCDYKPVYGYIFKKELKKYDFWGHCDLDMILGDLREFLTEDVLNNYEKIYQYGHLCLYKNTEENNKRFMSKVGKDYRQVFTTSKICFFDEVVGMEKKYRLLGIPTYKKRDCADICPWHDSFQRADCHYEDLTEEEKKVFNYNKQIFYWENGHVYRAYMIGNRVFKDEFNYIHFQKRKINFNNIPNAFYITREGIFEKVEGKLPNKKTIINYNGKRITKEIKKKIEYQKNIWQIRMNKYIYKR